MEEKYVYLVMSLSEINLGIKGWYVESVWLNEEKANTECKRLLKVLLDAPDDSFIWDVEYFVHKKLIQD